MNTKSKTQFVAIALLCCSLFASFAYQAAEHPNAEQILQRHVEAIGGADSMALLKNRHSEGSILYTSMDTPALLSIWETHGSNRLWRSRSETMGELKEGSAGDVAWTSSLMGGSRILTGPALARTQHQAPLDSPSRWKQNFSDPKFIEEAEIDGEACYVILGTPAEAHPERRYYSQASGLHLRTETTIELLGTSIPAVLSYSDYREVDGTLVAHHISQKYADIEEQIIQLNLVEHNIKLPGTLFDPPTEVRELLEQK